MPFSFSLDDRCSGLVIYASEGCNHVEYCTLGLLVTLMMKFISVTVSLLCSLAVRYCIETLLTVLDFHCHALFHSLC